MKCAVLVAFFSAAIAVGQDRAEPGHPKHIVGGEDTMAGEFPFVAKIIYGGYRVGCTGSLITPDKVLTAGHCVDRYGGGYDLELSVGFGNIRTENPPLPPPTGAPGQYRVEKILHPEYSTQENDIAILRLETAVEDIQPVRILTLKEELQLAPSGSRLGVAVGWGSTHPSGSGGELSGTLQTIADLPIYTAADCQQVIDDLREQGKRPQPPAIHEKVLCAGEEGRATGTGDSGGPLLVQTPEGWAQVGVLSQVTRDPYPQTVTYMAQYTRTSHFLDWIFPTYRLHFAHSASGGEWTTDLALVNLSQSKTVEAEIEVFSQSGELRQEEQFTLQPSSAVEWELPAGEGIETGGVVVSSPERLSGFLRFRQEEGAAISVQSAPVSTAFLVPVSNRANRTGLAVFNPGDQEQTVTLAIGGVEVEKAIPSRGKIARFVDEYFPSLENPTGVLEVRADGQITVLSLELIGSSLVTLPATPASQR